MNTLLKDHVETIEIVCDSFGWKLNRMRQFKRASDINDEMNIFLEEIKIILMNHKDEMTLVTAQHDAAQKKLDYNKIKLEILKMENFKQVEPIKTMINLFTDKHNDEGLRIELLTYLNTYNTWTD